MIELSDDTALLDVARVHGWLASSYWSPGIARDLVEEAIRLEKERRRAAVNDKAEEAAMGRLLDALTGKGASEATREAFRQRLVETRVRFKRLSEDDIQAYIGSGEWRGKAGGYAVQGIAGSFVVKMVGSYTNVVGLPLYETVTLLGGEGFPIRHGWLNAVAV